MKTKLSSFLLLGAVSLNAGFIDSIISSDSVSSIIEGYTSSYTSLNVMDILSDPTIGSIWSSYGGDYVIGGLELCYENKATSSNYSANLCDIFNSASTSLNPCSTLPNSVGSFTKKDNALSGTLPFKDYCSSLSDSGIKVDSVDAFKMIGLSGHSKADSTAWGSWENTGINKREVRVENAITALDVNKEANTAYLQKVNDLKKSGRGDVVLNELTRLSVNTNKITKTDLATVDGDLIFDNIKEYNNDLQASIKKDIENDNMILDYHKYIDAVNGEFSSINVTNNGDINKKNTYVNSFIDEKRKDYRKWAEAKAYEEVKNTISQKVDNYNVFFNKRDVLSKFKGNLSLSEDAKIAIINDDIVKQQYQEKLIYMKWQQIADDKIDALKIRLKKNMYASAVFDRTAEETRIRNLVSGL
jgi:hypothetical protein